MKRFLTPFILPANFAPDGVGGGADGGDADPAAGSGGDQQPGSLAAAAGVDPSKTPAAAGDSKAGEADPATDAGAGAGAGDGGEQKSDEQDAAAKLYAPDDLPEEYRGKDDRETIDKLLAALPKTPENEADYKYELTGETAKLVKNTVDDPVLAVYRGVSKEFGLTSEQSNGVFDKFIGQLVDKKMIPKPVDFDAELKLLEPDGESDPKAAAASAVARVQAGTDFVNGLKTRGVFDEDEANMFFGWANSARGVSILEKLAGQMKSHGVQSGGLPASGEEEKTQAEIMYPNSK